MARQRPAAPITHRSHSLPHHSPLALAAPSSPLLSRPAGTWPSSWAASSPSSAATRGEHPLLPAGWERNAAAADCPLAARRPRAASSPPPGLAPAGSARPSSSTASAPSSSLSSGWPSWSARPLAAGATTTTTRPWADDGRGLAGAGRRHGGPSLPLPSHREAAARPVSAPPPELPRTAARLPPPAPCSTLLLSAPLLCHAFRL